MELRLISVPDLNTHVKMHVVPRSTVRHGHRSAQVVGLGNEASFLKFPPLVRLEQKRHTKSTRWNKICLATDVDNIISGSSDLNSGNGVEGTEDGNQLTSSAVNPLANDAAEKNSNPQDAPKRTSLTAREKLRAARVLSKYTQSKPSKSKAGNKVLEALRESDQKNKKKAGLPEAPSNLFDDSKRGMPKQGLTFDFPGGSDLLIITFSFVFISTVMFATTYFVWKVGAIHFNDS